MQADFLEVGSAAPAPVPSGQQLTMLSESKDSEMVYVLVENCAVNTVPTDEQAVATLAIPRDRYLSFNVSVDNGDAEVGSGIHCPHGIHGSNNASVTVHYPAGNTCEYGLGLIDAIGTLAIDPEATDYTIRIERINEGRISVPDGLPAYQANEPDGTYTYTSGNGGTPIQVDAVRQSDLHVLLMR